MRAFEVIGSSGGIRKAAIRMGVTHAIVSRHLAGLEDKLGVVLFDRKRGQLTSIGAAYHTRLSAAFSEIEAATLATRPQRNESLKIWCSAGLSLHWLAHRLSDFRMGHARTIPLIELRATDNEPDYQSGEADGDLRYVLDNAVATSRDVVAMEIARPVVYPVASPSLINKISGILESRADILKLPLIHEGSSEEWHIWLTAQAIDIAPMPRAAGRYGQAHLTLAAAVAGQGIVLTNDLLAKEDLASGKLIRLEPRLENWSKLAIGAYYFRTSRVLWNDPLVSQFRKWLIRAVKAEA
jgi:LysR family transcriptional regulator, glycine cleavage system transcriptional activator